MGHDSTERTPKRNEQTGRADSLGGLEHRIMIGTLRNSLISVGSRPTLNLQGFCGSCTWLDRSKQGPAFRFDAVC